MKCITKYIGLVFLGLLLLACRDKQKPNSEFAPDMYEARQSALSVPQYP